MTTEHRAALESLRADGDATTAPPQRLTYQPALDGLRGVAVSIVVLFHLDIGIFSGGYLGVSVFFTLSGFLITSLLLDEWRERRDIDLGRFYVRRLKRLMPASFLILLSVVILVATGVLTKSAEIGGDVIAAALNVFNWHELGSGESYAELFRTESALAHFWSLAIEEQFYLVWPLFMLLLLRGLRFGRRALLITMVTLFLLSAVSALPASEDVTYFATWTRAAEILAGAMLAVWMSTSSRTEWPSWWRALGLPALAVVLVASLVTPTSTGWAYQGGLAVFALVSVALIAGMQSDTALRRVMATAPLVGLGRVSYGVYLVHWPVFVVLDERRIGTDGIGLSLLRLTVTGLIAVAMFVAVERPVRLSSAIQRPRSVIALAGACSLAMVGAAATTLNASGPPADAPTLLGAPSATAPPTTEPEAVTITSPVDDDEAPRPATTVPRSTTTVPPPAPTVIAIFGDSVPAWLLRDAASSFARTDVTILNGAGEACDGMVDLPLGRDRVGTELVPPDTCLDWTQSYPTTLSQVEHTDIGLLVLGQAPVIDRLIDEQWQGPCDRPEGAIDWYLDDVEQRIEFLRAHDVEPMLALPARFGKYATFMVPDDHPQRIDCVRSEMVRFAVDRNVAVIDLDPLLCIDGDCDELRSADGVHVDPPFAPLVLDQLLDLVLSEHDTAVGEAAPTVEPTGGSTAEPTRRIASRPPPLPSIE